MNKVVAILGIIVLITLGGLFFCAGFFTGTTISPPKTETSTESQADSEKKITTEDVDAVVDTKSATVSEKIMEILSSAADVATSTISDVVDSQKKNPELEDKSQVTIDSLLREIASSHAENDNCSPEKTLSKINTTEPVDPNSLQGKKIVFIGYFKNKIALQVQKLLIGRGYSVHVEASKTGDHESFVFCGPFKKEANAKKLVKWLKKNSFDEARIVSISNDVVEETIYDFVNDDSNLPQNTEKSAIAEEPSGDVVEQPQPVQTPIIQQPQPVQNPTIQQPQPAIQAQTSPAVQIQVPQMTQ